MPSIGLSQAKLFRNENGNPVAFMNWALVSDEVNERLKTGVGKLQPSDWRSGLAYVLMTNHVHFLITADRPEAVPKFCSPWAGAMCAM